MKKIAEIIRREIGENGALPFARFMELALYCPEFGYYEQQKDTIGRHGDFITSVSVGNLFGEMLAFQFAEWLEELRIANCELRIVEAGAHDGKLAKDILNWLQTNRPKLFSEIEYFIIEPSPRRQEWQRETLKSFAPRVRWLSDLKQLLVGRDSVEPKFKINHGIIFSNELLDAFTVHRFGWDAKNKKWFEWGVAVDGEQFVWAKIQNSKFKIQNSELESVLPDGYTIENSPAAENWWHEAAGILTRGKLLTIDYGLTDEELFSPVRKNGTLRGYFRHRADDDVLANVGEQDLTAHVNFSVIQKVGEEAGLKTENFYTQPQFLTQILAKTQRDKNFGEWNASRVRQFQTLTHPEHLGRGFRVLVQSR